MPHPPVSALVHESLGERVYKTVRDLIVGQLYSPGSKLNVERLCRDLGVSRTPVWDAMRRLEAEGLVETVPRLGVFVLNYSHERIHELFAVREALEGLAARSAAERLEPADLAGLVATAGRLAAAAAAPDLEQYSRDAIDFHNAIVAAARNQALARLLENVYAHMLVLRLQSLHEPDRLALSLAEHSEILAAIAARDPERAETVARRHARRVRDDVTRLVTTRAAGGGAGGRGSRRPRRAPVPGPARS